MSKLKSSLSLKVRLAGFITWHLRPAWLASRVKKWMRVQPVRLDFDSGSMIVDPLSNLGMRLIRDGFYEPELTEYFRRALKVGDTFLDVGANEGYFSVLANTLVGTSGKIISVEPQLRLHDRLRSNFLANGMSNFQLLPVAVSDAPGEAMMHLTPDMNSGASGLSRVTRYECETQRVELKTLDGVLSSAGVGEVNLMKMDIEGFEHEAILGSKGLFVSHRIRCLAVELHPELMTKRRRDPGEIVSFLAEQGYRHRRLGPVDVFEWLA